MADVQDFGLPVPSVYPRALILAGLTVLGMRGAVAAQQEVYPVQPALGEIEVDAKLDDRAWTDAVVVLLPYTVRPETNTAAPVNTRCSVTYDTGRLFFACLAYDPAPQRIRSYVTDRDGTDGHDRIVLTIDPFGDGRRGFQFGVNAHGVQSDAVFDAIRTNSNGNYDPVDESWDAIWSAAGRVTQGGFVIEASIPFKSLRFPKASGVQDWGFFFSRYWPRSTGVEIRSSRLDPGDNCELCQANVLRGFEGIAPGRNVEVAPTVTAGRSDLPGDASNGGLAAGDVVRDVGVDLRWNATPNLALNVAANPDFSQVESDAPQFDINNRFARLFEEKRPFFLEGADVFSTPLSAFFTRAVVNPRVGVKLTGKAGRHALGAVVVQDATNNVLIPGNQRSSTQTLDEDVITVAARYRRDLAKASTVGAMYVARDGGGGYYNRVGGVDAHWAPNSAITLRAQYLLSDTRYSEALRGHLPERVATGSYAGTAAFLSAQFNTREWFAFARVRGLSRGFRADAGFQPQVDVRMRSAWMHRTFWASPSGWFTSLRFSVGVWRFENQAGRLNQSGLWTLFRYSGPLQSEFAIGPSVKNEFFGGAEHRFSRLTVNGSLTPTGRLRFGVTSEFGGVVDLENSREAQRVLITPEATIRIGNGTDVRLSYAFQDVETVDGSDIFRATLAEIRLVHNFSSRLFVRGIAQLRDTDRKPEAHSAPVDSFSRQLGTQLLFSYKANPQAVIFLGYSDDRVGIRADAPDSLDLGLRGRTFFFKLGYAWRP